MNHHFAQILNLTTPGWKNTFRKLPSWNKLNELRFKKGYIKFIGKSNARQFPNTLLSQSMCYNPCLNNGVWYYNGSIIKMATQGVKASD